MARRTHTYAIRLAVEGGGQVKAELVSVGQSGEQSLKRIDTAGDRASGGLKGLGRAAANPCNPCAAANPCNPCNPCAATQAVNPCNPCAANPCNPCAANPCKPDRGRQPLQSPGRPGRRVSGRDPISAVAASVSISRRALLGSTAALAAAMVLAGTGPGRAKQKMPKQTAQYQDSPGATRSAQAAALHRGRLLSAGRGRDQPERLVQALSGESVRLRATRCSSSRMMPSSMSCRLSLRPAPAGYRAEVVVKDLIYPSGVESTMAAH